MTAAQIQVQIDRKIVSLAKAEDTLDGILDGGAQGYTLDSTQTRQTVTKINITELRKTIGSLENQIDILQDRLNSVPLVGRGAW